MKSFSRFFLYLLTAFSIAPSCEKAGEEDDIPGMEVVHYQSTDRIIANPERGFYSAQEIRNVSGKGISQDGILANRKNYRTLYLLEFHLTDFVASDISEDYLQAIGRYFASLRAGGAKCILRFCYSNGYSEKDKPWDATPEQALRHIAQLKPLLQEYYDVIFVVQAGFIGSWGEWYYTENYNDNAFRKAIVDALLDAVPDCRQIELRTPAFKMSLYGYALADTITRASAHQPTPLGRIGGHNDCYLASANDQGTYRGNNDRAYWAAESAYTIMGGETCGVSAFCHCEPQPDNSKAVGVLADMATNHFTYLNQGYNPNVLSRWKSEGCFEEIQKRLGYRYVLDKGQFTKNPQAGGELRVVLKLHNEGFAPVQNPRDAELVITDEDGKVLKTWALESDPRYWMPEETIVIDQTVTLPDGLSGEITLSLNLPDPCDNLHANPLYSIQFANEGVWNESAGYNELTTFTL